MLSKEQIDTLESQALVPTTVFSRHVVLDLISALREAQEDVARIEWLGTRKKLELFSDNSVWTREDGSRFVNSHRLAESEHMHGTGECLREIIDKAMLTTGGK